MVKLKNKIKTIESLPEEPPKKTSIISILISLIIFTLLSIGIFFIIKNVLPFINATDINKITGKKTNITDCNTKDYIIIGEDKSYSLSLTNDNCITKYYEGTIIIKNNEIIFNNNLKGFIDNKNNIIIKNKIFESDKNE